METENTRDLTVTGRSGSMCPTSSGKSLERGFPAGLADGSLMKSEDHMVRGVGWPGGTTGSLYQQPARSRGCRAT